MVKSLAGVEWVNIVQIHKNKSAWWLDENKNKRMAKVTGNGNSLSWSVPILNYNLKHNNLE